MSEKAKDKFQSRGENSLEALTPFHHREAVVTT